MFNANKIKSIFAAALILSSAFVSSCSVVKTGKEQENLTAPTDAATASVTTNPNVPDFLVGSTTSAAPTTSPSANTTDIQTAPTPDITEQETNQGGMVVDDWQEGLDLTKENPDDLYTAFQVDRQHREGFYKQISSETNFPIIHITTENNAEVVSLDDYVNCFVEVFNCDDIYKLDASSAGIRVRGNASANYGKVDWIRKNTVSYRIKFTEKQSMLGLNDFARCKSWILLKPYESAVENHLAFRVARAVNNGDYYCSDSTYVQLYVNEEYKGPYLLCEQTQENSERVDINEAENGYTGTDIGYLVELDNYATGDDDPYFYLIYNREEITDVYGTTRVPRKYAYSVKNDLYSDEQLKFIERYFEVAWEIPMRAIKYGEYYKVDENFNLVPAQDGFASAYDCISEIFDIQSVVDMYITYEIVNDQDVGGGSFFFAVDFGQDPTYKKLTMVAPWDFDWGYMDYHSDSDGGLYAAKFKDSYFVENWGDRSNPWLILFYSADWFQELVKNTWRERFGNINAAIDEVEDLVVNYADDLNKDGTRRSGSAMTTIKWTRNRVEYLNTLWG